MLPFRRWPKRFQVMVHGSNFSLVRDGDSEPLVGFYTTRWVYAFNSEQASNKAFDLIRKRLVDRGYLVILDHLILSADEVKEVAFGQSAGVNVSDLHFIEKETNSAMAIDRR